MLNTEGLARNEAYKRRIIEFNADPRVEGHGFAGDILIWHHHATGIEPARHLQKHRGQQLTVIAWLRREARTSRLCSRFR